MTQVVVTTISAFQNRSYPSWTLDVAGPIGSWRPSVHRQPSDLPRPGLGPLGSRRNLTDEMPRVRSCSARTSGVSTEYAVLSPFPAASVRSPTTPPADERPHRCRWPPLPASTQELRRPPPRLPPQASAGPTSRSARTAWTADATGPAGGWTDAQRSVRWHRLRCGQLPRDRNRILPVRRAGLR